MSEGTVSYNGKLTIKEVIANLEFLKTSKTVKSSVLIDTINCAIKLVAQCSRCMGTGEQENFTQPVSGYKVRVTPRGYRVYVTPCSSCRGSGKHLDVECCSCGKSAALMPEQRHYSHCHECETRLRLKGTLS